MAIGLPSHLSDHPNLVGIVRFPNCRAIEHEVPIPLVIKDNNGKYMSLRQVVDMTKEIYSITKESKSYFIPKQYITDFYPYTFYVLTDGESEPLIMYPQYMPNNSIFKGKFALSNQPVERYYLQGYKGDNDGRVYNITNHSQMLLPTATNEGLQLLNANANTITQTRDNQIMGNILNGVNVVGSALATGGMSLIGGGVSSVISGVNSVKETDVRNKDTMLTPSTISSFGSPSTRKAFNNDNVRLIRYTVKDNVKNKINNYVKRYGNKYNNYTTIDIKNYKGYIKFIDVDIDGGIDNIYLNKIIEILERGIYIE